MNAVVKNVRLLFGLLILWSLPACANMQQLSNLKLANFELDRVSDMSLAGINVQNLKSANISGVDLIRLTSAVYTRSVPLSFTLHVGAQLPAQVPVKAALSTMEWTLFIQDKQAVSGVVNQAIDLPAGVKTDIPVQVNLNAVDFFEGNAQNILSLVKNLVGQGDVPVNLKLVARPTFKTPIGNFRYPQNIEIVNRTVANP